MRKNSLNSAAGDRHIAIAVALALHALMLFIPLGTRKPTVVQGMQVLELRLPKKNDMLIEKALESPRPPVEQYPPVAERDAEISPEKSPTAAQASIKPNLDQIAAIKNLSMAMRKTLPIAAMAPPHAPSLLEPLEPVKPLEPPAPLTPPSPPESISALPPDQTSVPAEILPALPPEARPSLAEQLEAMPPEAPLAPAEALASKQVGPPPQIAAEAAPATVAEEIRLAAASVIEPAIEPGPSLANAPAPLTSPHILNPVHAVSRFGTSFVSQMPIKPPGIKKAGPAEGFKPAAPVANGQPTVEEHNLGYSGLPGEVEVQQATGAAVEAQSGEALPPPVAIAVKPEYPENPIIRAPEFPQASLAPFPENLPEAMPSPEMTPTPPMLKPAISPEALPEPESRWPPAMAQEADATPAISPLPVLANAPAPEPEPALAPVPLRSEASAAETIPTEPIAAIKAATADEVLARLSSLIATQKTYPEAARRRNSEGVVKIGVIIRSDGSLKSSKLVARSGSAVLDRAASDLLKELFPITFNLADEMEVVVTISYKLSR